MRTLVALAICSACGSDDHALGDASVTPVAPDSRHVDAPIDAREPTCAATEFTTSTPVAALNTTSDDVYVRLSPDELTAYFSRHEPDETAYVATRASTAVPFSTPSKLTITGNGILQTTSLTVTADGLTLYFTSNRPGTMGMRDIWRATRASTSATFGNITAMTELNSASMENDVMVLPDGSAIYFSSNRSGLHRIYRADKQGSGFASPDEVLNGSTNVFRVAVSPDERTMVYSTGGDMRLSTRSSPSISWPTGVPLDKIATTGIDVPDWISPDLCRLYFTTNSSGNDDIRIAVRTPL